MANPRKKRDARATELELLIVKVPTGLVARLDARLGEMAKEIPGVRVTRSDLVRNLLETGLAKGGA